MANRPGYGGFRWVKNKYSPDANTPPRMTLPIASAYATSLYQGQPIKLVDGAVEAATAGDAIYGIFDGCKQVYSATTGFVGPAPIYAATVTYSTNVTRQTMAHIILAKGQIFRVTCDDNTTFTTLLGYQDAVQENAEWTAGTPSGDRHGALLDISTNDTTNTLSVRIENVPDTELTDFAATGVELEVTFNLIQDTTPGSATGTTN